jgi:hypothetical protein
MSAFDPKRTLSSPGTNNSGDSRKLPGSIRGHFRLARLTRYDALSETESVQCGGAPEQTAN